MLNLFIEINSIVNNLNFTNIKKSLKLFLIKILETC